MQRLISIFSVVSLTLSAAAQAELPKLAGADLISGQNWSLQSKKDSKGLVVVFMSAKCPCSASHEALLRQMAKDYADFQFVGVHSNIDEPQELTAPHFKAAALPFPVLQDKASEWANHFGALKTPHVFVLSPEGATLYAGGVTDSSIAGEAKENFLKLALNEIRQSGSTKVKTRRTLGCMIRRK